MVKILKISNYQFYMNSYMYMSMKQSLFKRSIVFNKQNAILISTRPLSLPGNTCLNKSTNKKFYCLNF